MGLLCIGIPYNSQTFSKNHRLFYHLYESKVLHYILILNERYQTYDLNDYEYVKHIERLVDYWKYNHLILFVPYDNIQDL